MPKFNKNAGEFSLEAMYEMQDGKPVIVGMKPKGVIYFDSFGKEREGSSYAVAVKARGENGRVAHFEPTTDEDGSQSLPDSYTVLPLIKNAAGEQMYVRKDWTLGSDPYVPGSRRQVADEFISLAQKATDWSSLDLKIVNPELIWPDGRFRTLALSIKANNALLPEEFEAQAAQGVQKRQLTKISSIDNAGLADRTLDLMLYNGLKEKAKRSNIALAQILPENLQYLLDEEREGGEAKPVPNAVVVSAEQAAKDKKQPAK